MSNDTRVLASDTGTTHDESTRMGIRVTGGMRVNVYAVLERAVDEGVAYGLRRAHKYTDTPTEQDLVTNVTREVMNAICEFFQFDPEWDDKSAVDARV